VSSSSRFFHLLHGSILPRDIGTLYVRWESFSTLITAILAQGKPRNQPHGKIAEQTKGNRDPSNTNICSLF